MVKSIEVTSDPSEPVVTDGVMEEINDSGVSANIDVEPNNGSAGTPIEIEVFFTSGANLVTDINMYSFSGINFYLAE